MHGIAARLRIETKADIDRLTVKEVLDALVAKYAAKAKDYRKLKSKAALQTAAYTLFDDLPAGMAASYNQTRPEAKAAPGPSAGRLALCLSCCQGHSCSQRHAWAEGCRWRMVGYFNQTEDVLLKLACTPPAVLTSYLIVVAHRPDSAKLPPAICSIFVHSCMLPVQLSTHAVWSISLLP
eukprot:6201739-Pleurochrysis_carterae.AAC.1